MKWGVSGSGYRNLKHKYWRTLIGATLKVGTILSRFVFMETRKRNSQPQMLTKTEEWVGERNRITELP